MAEVLKVVGVMQVEMRYGSHSVDHLLYICGAWGWAHIAWLQKMHLNWPSLSIAYIRENSLSLQDLLQKYDKLFSEELGTMKEFSAKVVMKPGARSQFHH